MVLEDSSKHSRNDSTRFNCSAVQTEEEDEFYKESKVIKKEYENEENSEDGIEGLDSEENDIKIERL